VFTAVGMKRTTIILINLILTSLLFAQQTKVIRDFGVWGVINIEKNIGKDFEIELAQQLRFYSTATQLDDYIVDLGGKYKINKNFRLGANLRYTYNAKRWKETENNYRYNFDLRYKGRIMENLNLHYRLRYQHEYVNTFSEYLKTNIHHSNIRHRAKAEYKINKLHTSYFSAELFRLMEPFIEPYWNKVRFFIGDEIASRIGEFDVSFGYELETNTKYPLSFFFIKTKYTLKL